jgi:hypothetical protein
MISILDNPDTFAPAYNPMMYVLSSTNISQANFKYVCDIYIGSGYVRLKHDAEPTTNYGVFDIHRIVENFLTYDISGAAAVEQFLNNSNSLVEYTVKFGEEFGLSTTGTTVYSNQVVDSARYAFNAALDFHTHRTFLASDVLMNNGSPVVNFLTSSPDTMNIRSSEAAYLYCMSNTSGSIYYAEIKTYTSAGALIGTWKLRNAGQDAATQRNWRIPSGTANLLLIDDTTFDSGIQPVITASTSYYTIRITRFNGTVVSETKRYNIDDTCTNNDVYRLHFLNKWGGFDSFSFIRASTLSTEVSRTNYKKNVGSSAGGVFTINAYERQDIAFNTDYQDRLVINSDWLTDDESTWLKELVTSPVVFLDRGTYYEAVNIVETAYQTRKSVTDRVFNLRLTLHFTYNNPRQRA